MGQKQKIAKMEGKKKFLVFINVIKSLELRYMVQ